MLPNAFEVYKEASKQNTFHTEEGKQNGTSYQKAYVAMLHFISITTIVQKSINVVYTYMPFLIVTCLYLSYVTEQVEIDSFFLFLK